MSRRRPLPREHAFVKAVATALRRRCGVKAGDRLLVAVSGGCDSVALLRALAALAPQRGWELQLAVGTVQHHLRKSAEADAAFVEELARTLKLPFLRADLNPPRRGTENREAWARRERYAALATMAASFSASAVVTAHHADDQLETLLMRLLRGASVRGLAAMPWRRSLAPGPVRLIRPMLAVDRAAGLDFLRSLRQRYRTDPTNADTSRLRAALRERVIPALRSLRPDAARRAVHLTDHLRQVAALLDGEVSRAADKVLRDDSSTLTLGRVDARLLPPVVLTGLLRRLLREAGVPADRLTRRTLAPILRAARDPAGGQRRFTLAGASLLITRELIRVTDAKHERPRRTHRFRTDRLDLA